MAKMRVGILTGGGDCPGLNAVIRAAVRRGVTVHDYEFLGIKKGWLGLVHGDTIPLGLADVEEILPVGGTILGSSRTNPFGKNAEEEVPACERNFSELGLDALLAVGGDDTLGVARQFSDRGLPMVGAPKTIDNDLSGTDFTFGFWTAIERVMCALDDLRTTAKSHERIFIVEAMGRHAGWIAGYGGVAGAADYILTPEASFSLDEVLWSLRRRWEAGYRYAVVVVAEGAEWQGREVYQKDLPKDEFGHVYLGGIGFELSKAVGQALAPEFGRKAGDLTRHVVLSHLQRGGTPCAFDRILATRFGAAAVDLIAAKKFGYMVALAGNAIVPVEITDAVSVTKRLDQDFLDLARNFYY